MAITFVLPPSLGSAKATARAELIEAALARTLDEPATVLVAESYAELEERAASRDVALVWAPAAVCAKLAAARAVFTIVRAGRPTYRSALVALHERALGLDKLTGLSAAWVDPLSAGGYLLVAALLRERGLDPDRIFASQLFAGSHRAAVEAVLHGTADVAAVSIVSPDDAAVAEMMRWYAGPAGDRLTPLAITDECPNDAVVITNALAEDEAARLAEKLVPATPNARARSRLLSALEAEDLVPSDLGTYRKLRGALLRPEATRRTWPPRSR
ncbi:Phosphonate ABC transporter phosphate-binding periplasmic component [Minicystis rosea]|nr:Phosphonate ABC transporter phosphate-binding periplasmic component [Minicystis rosea]